MEREASADPEEEDYAMPEAEAPSSNTTAEVPPAALRADSVSFIHSPDHDSAGMDIQHGLEVMPSLDDTETQGDVAHSSIPIIELDNPWADDAGRW